MSAGLFLICWLAAIPNLMLWSMLLAEWDRRR